MSSIMTNASAMTALKTLQMTNKNLDQTQNRISTGYKVAEAADNAAYWSIATTMRSDNKALGTVQEALGLGAATVDVAYTAMNATKDVLDQIKTKLVAATQPGVDKSKIHSDISELQKQLTTYANAASFSGNNWLAVDSSNAATYKATQQVVSSFNRTADNAVSIGTIDIDITGIALFDASATGNGLLQGGTAGSVTSAAFTWSKGDMDAGGSITVSVKVDGEATAQDIAITVDNPDAFTLDDIVAGLNATTGGLSGATASNVDGKLVITSNSTGTNSNAEITAVAAKKADASASTATTAIVAATGTAGAATGGGVMDINITNASAADLSRYINQVDAMSANVVTAASNLGSVKSRVDMQSDFVNNLMKAIDRGVGALVDADMSEESTRLQALQTQQQLGIQALSIANSNSQSILALFRG